jgi:hypothetical protein
MHRVSFLQHAVLLPVRDSYPHNMQHNDMLPCDIERKISLTNLICDFNFYIPEQRFDKVRVGQSWEIYTYQISIMLVLQWYWRKKLDTYFW